MASKSLAMNRIAKDLKEMKDFPIPGIGTCLMNDRDLFEILLNIQIQQGRYKGFIVHIMMFLSENYPNQPPRVLILPGQCYNKKFHPQIQPDDDGYFQFCIDILTDKSSSSSVSGLGWSTSSTLSTLLIQIQTFLSEPLFKNPAQPLNDAQLLEIEKKMRSFIYQHEINGKKVIHKSSQPIPSLAKKNDLPPKQKKNLIEGNVECFMTKENYASNPSEVFGYPILVTKYKFQRLEQTTVAEILCLSGFKWQMNNAKIEKVDVRCEFQSGLGEKYNAFLPVYLNEKHFERALGAIKTSLGEISSQLYFESQVIEVFPRLLNRLAIQMIEITSSMNLRVAAVEAYIHLTQLFHRLIQDIPSLRSDIERKVVDFATNDQQRSKQNSGDLGEFLVILSASRFAFTREIVCLIYREFMARNVAGVKGEFAENFRKLPEGPRRLEEVFKSSLKENKNFVIAIEASKKFSDVMKSPNSPSFISATLAEEFLKEQARMAQYICNYEQMIEAISLEEFFPHQEACYELFKAAVHLSNLQRYTQVDLEMNPQTKATPVDLKIRMQMKSSIKEVLIGKKEYPIVLEVQENQKKEKVKNEEKIAQQKQQQQVLQSLKNQASAASSKKSNEEDAWHTVSKKKIVEQYSSDKSFSDEEDWKQVPVKKQTEKVVEKSKKQAPNKVKAAPKGVKLAQTKFGQYDQSDEDNDGQNVVKNSKI